MKKIPKCAAIFLFALTMFTGFSAFSQNPTYSCVATNDTLLNANVYQFDIYIYRTGTTDLYLNNYQLSFKISNTAAILNGGTLSGTYLAGSSQLPAAWTPAGVSILSSGGIDYVRVNGVLASSNGTLIPTTGLRIGTFQVSNTAAYGQSNMNLVWWNTVPGTSSVRAIVPPAPTGTVVVITDMLSHTTNFTDPILNAPVTAFNMTGSGAFCTTGPVGLDGSQTGVLYQLLQNAVPIGSYYPGTGSALAFGNQIDATYTSTAYRKATYLTGTMNGSAILTAGTGSPTLSGLTSTCEGPASVGTGIALTVTG